MRCENISYSLLEGDPSQSSSPTKNSASCIYYYSNQLIDPRKRRGSSFDSTSSENDISLAYKDPTSDKEDIIAVLRKQRTSSTVHVATDVDSENCNYLNDVACIILVGIIMLLVLLFTSHGLLFSFTPFLSMQPHFL